MTDRTVRVRVVAELPGLAATMRAGAAATLALGDSAAAAGRGVRALGTDAEAARAGVASLAAGAKGGTAALAESEAAGVAAGRGIKAASVEADAARGAFGRIGRIGQAARDGMESVKSGAESALEGVQHLGLLLAGGAVIYGLHDIVEQGNEYNDAMNKFLEVTRASGAQMQAAGAQAQALGADIKLPTASAAEAADAMSELAKAGLSAGDAIKAARGTIQLAAAARTDIATAAKIEGDILDEFSLKAGDATKVADTLANTVNSSSGELMDLYYAMKYVGPVAHSMSISLTDVATAVGLLGRSGIIGETAGTALRSALVNMSKPTKQASEGLKQLGIDAFDSQGNFKGLEYVITQLGLAQKNMTSQQFTAAAAMAFGKPALAAMVALAHQGGPAFQQYSLQVGRVGGAAALAAAESKGLGGAMRTLGKEISSTFLQVYLGISPVLESITRGLSASVSDAIPYVQRGIKTATDLWDIYGPTVVAHLAAAGSGIGHEAEALVVPLRDGLTQVATTAVPLAITSVSALGTTLHNAEQAVQPVVSGFTDLASGVTSNAGALGVLAGRLQAGVSLFGQASAVLQPLGQLVGALAHDFAALPGPIQLSVISMLAMRPFQPQIQSMRQSVEDFGRSAVQSFNDVRGSIQIQNVLAQQAGVELGTWGSAMAAIEARVPIFQDMANSFRTTSAAIEEGGGKLSGFRATAAGVATALGTGAKAGLLGAMRGLWSFLGGPWGVAIGAAMIGLDLLAKHQQEAAQAAAEHQARISSLTQAIQQSNGVINGSVRAAAVQQLADTKLADGKTQLIDVMHAAGVSTLELTNAYLGQGTSIAALRQQLYTLAAQHSQTTQTAYGPISAYDAQGTAANKAADALAGLDGEATTAIAKQKDLAAAVAGSGAASLDATNPTGRLQTAIDTLASSESDAETKANALHTALQLLSGGELDVEAATANMNQAILDLRSSWKDGVDKANGWGKALLQADGSLNTLSENGQTLWTKLQALNSETASAAQATFDYAKASGDSLPAALAKAEAPMQQAWQAAVQAGESFGLTADQAKNLAAQMGFIPSNLAITMSTPGMTETQKDLLYVQGLQGHLDAGATVKVSALTDEATKDLEAIGFKITALPGGRQVEITVPPGQAFSALDGILSRESALHDKTVTVTYQVVNHQAQSTTGFTYANGGITHFASGSERHDPQIAPAGAWRVWAEPETGGEAYIPLGMGKRTRSKHLLEQVAKMMGGRVAWFANGGVSAFAGGGFTYTPNLPVLGGATDPMTRYNAAIKALDAAWKALTAAMAAQAKAVAAEAATRKRTAASVKSAQDNLRRVESRRHTHAELVAAEDRLTAARRAAASADDAAAKKAQAAAKATAAARSAVNAADASLGVARGSKAPTGFDLTAYKKQLQDSLNDTEAWRKNLAAVGARGGSAVEQILQNMGADGTALTAALAKASKADFNTIVKNLQRVSDQAKATLADFDTQVAASAKTNSQFASDLSSLAARGYGSLAQQLASQGDQSAIDLAREAAGASDSQLAKINGDVQKQAATLSGQDLQNALLVISTLRSKPGEGISDVIAGGIAAQDLLTLVPKILPQLQQLPDAYKRVFLQQWATQSGGTAMFNGGILPDGSYTVLAGERGTGGEAYIPLGSAHRARSTDLLGEVASRFGYQLVSARTFGVQPAAASGGGPAHVTHHREVHLHGAKQDSATQAADILRHMVALG